MPAPTLISYTEVTSWQTGASPKAIASISWQTSDVLVCGALSEDATGGTFALTLPTNTGSGLTWSNKVTAGVGSFCASRIDTAVAASASSGVITVTPTGTGAATKKWGFGVWVYRGSAGVGNGAEQHTTTKTKALVPVGADAAIVWLVGDFSADPAPAGTPTSPSITTRQSFRAVGAYSGFAGDMADQTSAGSVSYGITTSGTVGPYSIVIVEVKAGTASFVPYNTYQAPILTQ